MAVDPVTRKLVWEQFEKDSPPPGPGYNDWVHAHAAGWGIPESSIRRIITEGSAVATSVVNKHVATFAQGMAEKIGADLTAAFEVLREGLQAGRKRVLVDKQGNPRLIDNRPPPLGPGAVLDNMVTVETPDWSTRMAAVRMCMDLFGAYGARPAQRYEMNVEAKVQTVNLNMSADEMRAEIERLRHELPKFVDAYAEITGGTPLLAGAGEAPEGAAFH